MSASHDFKSDEECLDAARLDNENQAVWGERLHSLVAMMRWMQRDGRRRVNGLHSRLENLSRTTVRSEEAGGAHQAVVLALHQDDAVVDLRGAIYWVNRQIDLSKTVQNGRLRQLSSMDDWCTKQRDARIEADRKGHPSSTTSPSLLPCCSLISLCSLSPFPCLLCFRGRFLDVQRLRP